MGSSRAPELPQVDEEALIDRETAANRPNVNNPFGSTEWNGNTMDYGFSPFIQDAADRMAAMAAQGPREFQQGSFGNSEMAGPMAAQGSHLQNRKGQAQNIQTPEFEQFSYNGRSPTELNAEFESLFERPPEYDPSKYFDWVQDFFGDSMVRNRPRAQAREAQGYRPGILGF